MQKVRFYGQMLWLKAGASGRMLMWAVCGGGTEPLTPLALMTLARHWMVRCGPRWRSVFEEGSRGNSSQPRLAAAPLRRWLAVCLLTARQMIDHAADFRSNSVRGHFLMKRLLRSHGGVKLHDSNPETFAVGVPDRRRSCFS